MTTPSQLLESARHFARVAAEILITGRPDAARMAAVATDTKTSPTDIVTERDIASEKAIVDAIRSAYPEDGILGEEGANISGTSGRTWIIDPLDGTINYLYGSPNWAVSIAVADEAGTIVGVVYAPLVPVEYFAIRDQGAWRIDHDGEVRLPPAADVSLDHALFATGFGYRREQREHQIRVMSHVLPRIRDIRRKGSAALDLCMSAAGIVNGYFETGAHPWDYAAGALVAREAGLIVSGLHGKPESSDMVVCAPAQLYSQIRALLEDVQADHAFKAN